MLRRIGAPRRWERSLAERRSCIQSCKPNPGRRRPPCLLRGCCCWGGRLPPLMGRVVSFMVVVRIGKIFCGGRERRVVRGLDVRRIVGKIRRGVVLGAELRLTMS